MSFTQYIKDTQAELKHVAWPTQTQTIVYTVLVVGVSILVALYIGFFDFFFTRGLEEVIEQTGGSPSSIPVQTQQPSAGFNVLPGTQTGTENIPVITNEPAPAEGPAPEAN